MEDKKYKIRYDLAPEVGSFTKDEIGDMGGTDSFLVVSCLYPEDGSFSMLHTSLDGRTGEEMTGRELFKIFIMLGKNLSERSDLDDLRKEISKFPAESFFAAIKGTGI